MCVIPVVFLIIVRSYVWITRSQTQQFLTSIINIIRYQQLHVSALHVGHHQVVTLDQGSYTMVRGNINGSGGSPSLV